LLSPLIIRIQAPGFDSHALAVGSTLSYFFFLVIPLSCPIALMRVALNSVGEFGIAGAGKVVDSVLKIVCVATLSRKVGIISLALGVLAGAVCQLLLFYSCLRRRGYRFGYSFNLHHAQLRRAVGLMLYPLGGQVSGMTVDVISNNLSSLLGPGKVTALRFATRIIDALAGVLANSIVTVATPVVVSAVARGDDEGVTEHFRQSIHLLLLVTIPVSVWLALANRPLIALIYRRMNFTTADVDLVSSILVLMIPYIFLSRLLGLAELPFFGVGNTRTPMLVAVAQAGICVLLTYLLFRSLELYAFPIARIVSYLVTSVYLLSLVSSEWGNLNLKALSGSTVRIVTASSVMGVGVLLGQKGFPGMPGDGFLADVVGLAAPSVLGGIVALCAFVPLKIVVVRRAESFPFMKVWLHVP
jgi:putative peptidoglycan lipid II flippase